MSQPKKSKRKPVRGPADCGKCKDGYREALTTKHYTGVMYCLCERGQWRHQLARKREYADRT